MLALTGKVKGKRMSFPLRKPAICLVKLLVMLLLVSCQKKTAIDSMNCCSVAYVIDSINYKGKIMKTDTAICWRPVCDAELDRFLTMPKTHQAVCGRPGCYWRLVIWK